MLLIRRDYYAGKDRPYRGVWHTTEDREISKHDLLLRLMDEAGITDGDEFEITVRKTGRRPFGNRRWNLQRPHFYGPETDEQMEDRL